MNQPKFKFGQTVRVDYGDKALTDEVIVFTIYYVSWDEVEEEYLYSEDDFEVYSERFLVPYES